MSFLDAWYARIESDLAPFIDPGTTLELSKKGNVIEASWMQRRREVAAKFSIKEISDILVEFDGKAYSYRGFFASELMSDILGMARSTLQLHRAAAYVETRGTTNDLKHDAVEGFATSIISKLVGLRDEESILTSFIMVTGEAGAGKTSVLKELVRRQAEQYTKGQSDFVYLYVDAQGRALARFNEALATELNDLRVQLPIHAVPPMVRLGLIVPVIDGFDELIGVGGYDDAFSSISSFVEQLEGKGAIVASSRSTYYEQEFLARANRASQFEGQSWRLFSLEVKSWDVAEREDFVRLKAHGDNDLAGALSQKLAKVFSGENAPLGKKPLFVVRVGDYLIKGEDLSGEGRLLEQLVDAFLTREQKEKLLNKNGKPILSKEELRNLCADLAEEMWNLGTRELDRVTVRDLAELAMAGSETSAADRTTVVERMPSMAFLQPGESIGSVSFEHELFFDLFLTDRFSSKITGSGPGLPLFLGRSAMPDSLAEAVASHILESGCADIIRVTDTLSDASTRQSPRQQFVRENAGRVVGFMAKEARILGGSGPSRIAGLVFPGSGLSGVVFQNISFESVEFKRVDLHDARFVRCHGSTTMFEAPLLNSGTVLDIEGIEPSDFIGVRVAGEEDTVSSLFDPVKITECLSEMKLPSAQGLITEDVRAVSPEVIKLVERLARAYARCNPICLQDDFLTGIFEEPTWPGVMKAALSSGIIKEEVRPAHGTRRNFIRKLVRSEELSSGLRRNVEVSASVRAFWDELEEQFPG